MQPRKSQGMKYTSLLNEIQTQMLLLHGKINELMGAYDISVHDVYITRQEAADMLGKGLRQLDRDCKKYNIRRKKCNNGIRISKYDIMKHLGMIEEDQPEMSSTVDFSAAVPKQKSVEQELTEFERIMMRAQQ